MVMRYHLTQPLPRPDLHRWSRGLWVGRAALRSDDYRTLSVYETNTLSALTLIMSHVTNALARGAHALTVKELAAFGYSFKARAMRKHMKKLADLGWIRWFDDGWREAWHVHPDYSRHDFLHPRVRAEFLLNRKDET